MGAISTFASFNIDEKLVHALSKLGYTHPCPVQERVIHKALVRQFLVCQYVTDPDETHSYLIPILENLYMHLPKTQAIIFCPSSKLARQVNEFAFTFIKYFQTLKVRLFTSETKKSQNS